MNYCQATIQTLVVIFGLIGFVVGLWKIEPFYGPFLWFYKWAGLQEDKFKKKGGFVPFGGQTQIRLVVNITHAVKWTRLYEIRDRKSELTLDELTTKRQRNISIISILIATMLSIITIWTQ